MGVFDDLIEEGEEILASGDCNKTKQFIRRGEMLLSDGNKSLRASLYIHRMTVNGYPPYTGDEQLADVKTIVSAARMAIEQRQTKLRELEASSARLNISAQATANAHASIDAAIDFVASCNSLDDADREKIELLLRRLESDAKKSDEHGFAENAKSALDLADKAAGLVPKVAAAIGGLSGMFG